MKRKTKIKIAIGIPIFLCLAGWIFCAVETRSAHANVQRARLAARQVGMPLEFEDILTSPPPANANAAPLYERAAELLKGPLKQSQNILNEARMSPSVGHRSGVTSSNVTQTVSEALSRIQPVLASLDTLPSRPDCQFQRDWRHASRIGFSELVSMRALITDFCLDADAKDAAGDKNAAIRDLAFADRISTDAGSDPILIGLLVQAAGEEICNHEYEKLVRAHSRDVPFLNEVENQLKTAQPLPDIRRGLAGELVTQRAALRQVQSLREFMPYGSSEDEAPKPSSFEKMFFQSQYAQDTFEAALLDKWRIGWSQFPAEKEDWAAFTAGLTAISEAVRREQSFSNKLNQVLLVTFNHVPDLLGTLQARQRLLLTSIELLKIHATTGKFPSALPAILGANGVDPFDGNPLRYRPNGQGFILYSIGSDRIDNGGRARSPYDTEQYGFDDVVEFN